MRAAGCRRPERGRAESGEPIAVRSNVAHPSTTRPDPSNRNQPESLHDPTQRFYTWLDKTIRPNARQTRDTITTDSTE
jgi:hypothetical protein